MRDTHMLSVAWLKCLFLLFALIGVVGAAGAATLRVEHGNIVFDGKPITASGHDSAAVLSPDASHIAFLRAAVAAKNCAADGSPARAAELWIIGSDGNGAHRLVATRSSQDPAGAICDFSHVQFNSNATRLYFETPAYATSGAIHVVDLLTQKEQFFLPGNGLTVLARCKNDKYRDDIITTQHRYFVFSGSYDWAFLFTSKGTEVGPLGEEDYTSDLADACS